MVANKRLFDLIAPVETDGPNVSLIHWPIRCFVKDCVRQRKFRGHGSSTSCETTKGRGAEQKHCGQRHELHKTPLVTIVSAEYRTLTNRVFSCIMPTVQALIWQCHHFSLSGKLVEANGSKYSRQQIWYMLTCTGATYMSPAMSRYSWN